MIQRRAYIKRTPIKKKPYKIKKVSDKRATENEIYKKRRRIFLDAHPVCCAKWVCSGAEATDIHHKKDRIGVNFLDETTWMAVCRRCHRKIGDNSEEAFKRGFTETRMATTKKVILWKRNTMATNLSSDYEGMPIGEPSSEGPGAERPANYKELGIEKRQQWNNFIRWLNQDKKMGGSEELDKRDRSRGLEYMEEYRKKNPSFSITADQVPSIQYEINLLKDVSSLPDQQNLNPNVTAIISDYYRDRQVSPVDGWIGSLTSRQAYPEILEFDDDPNKRRWGLDYSGASTYANQSKRWAKSAGKVITKPAATPEK